MPCIVLLMRGECLQYLRRLLRKHGLFPARPRFQPSHQRQSHRNLSLCPRPRSPLLNRRSGLSRSRRMIICHLQDVQDELDAPLLRSLQRQLLPVPLLLLLHLQGPSLGSGAVFVEIPSRRASGIPASPPAAERLLGPHAESKYI